MSKLKKQFQVSLYEDEVLITTPSNVEDAYRGKLNLPSEREIKIGDHYWIETSEKALNYYECCGILILFGIEPPSYSDLCQLLHIHVQKKIERKTFSYYITNTYFIRGILALCLGFSGIILVELDVFGGNFSQIDMGAVSLKTYLLLLNVAFILIGVFSLWTQLIIYRYIVPDDLTLSVSPVDKNSEEQIGFDYHVNVCEADIIRDVVLANEGFVLEYKPNKMFSSVQIKVTVPAHKADYFKIFVEPLLSSGAVGTR